MKYIFILFANLLTIMLNANSIDSTLQANRCSLNFRIGQYDYDRYNRSINEKYYPVTFNQSVQPLIFNELLWNVKHNIEEIEKDTYELYFEFKLLEGKSKQTAPSLEINFDNWSIDNYLLLPAAAYNGNRFDSRRIRYSPKLMDPRDIGKDMPPIISDVPRLNVNDGPSVIQERSGSMTVPASGFHNPMAKKGFWLLFEQKNNWGDYGFTVEENRERNTVTFSITSPVVREKYKYRITDSQFPSDDRAPDLQAGDKVSFKFRLYFFDSENIQSLYDKFFTIRKDFVPETKENYTIPFSACFDIQEKKFNTQNFVEEHGYYAVGMRNGKYPFLQDWQIGWTGGMISTYPLLFMGSKETEQNVVKNFDFLFPDGICPAGFFYDAGESKGDEFFWYGGDIRKMNTKNWHLIRKSGDAIYYISKQFMLMELKGIRVKEQWKTGLKQVCDAIVELWEVNQQFGQFIDSQTGEIKVGGSTSGAIIPAGMVLASNYFKNEKYLDVARESADYFYKNYIQKGITMGGPGDAMQNPDSESGYAMLESFMKLYEATKETKWLDMAEDMARQFSTWVMAYDYEFPQASTLGKLGITTKGSVFANTQNKHGAPGICTHSGVALLRLYRATGNRAYCDLLQDITKNIPQNLSHPLRPIEGMETGWMSERVSTTDWLEGIGELMYGSTWAETSLMLTTTELPSVYVQPDKAYIAVFDQLKTEIKNETKKDITIQITNPTNLDSKIKILVENQDEYSKSLGENKLFGHKEESLKAGETKTFKFKK